MAELKLVRDTKKVKLTKCKGTVELFTWLTQAEDDKVQRSYTAGQVTKVGQDGGTTNELEFSMDTYYAARDMAVLTIISSWDLTVDGEPLEVTMENIGLLPASDFVILNAAVDEILASRAASDATKKP